MTDDQPLSISDDGLIEAVCRVMVTAKWHTFQSVRLEELLRGPLRFAAEQEHIWWGVSVEDKKYGLPRIQHLQDAPARVRFFSIEPLLEDLREFNLSGISWAIVGGESGPGARPMRKERVISVRDQCPRYHIPFFFKQWGGVRKAKNAGCLTIGLTRNIRSALRQLFLAGQAVLPLLKTF